MTGTKRNIDVIAIGGSAGSFMPVLELTKELAPLRIPMVIIQHRLKEIHYDRLQVFSNQTGLTELYEPVPGMPMEKGKIYFAPADYHLLIEEDHTFSLDLSDKVHYSRPSIDVTMESLAWVIRSGMIAILLSGANSDGAEGMRTVQQQGGITLIQSPEEAEYPLMPNSALELFTPDKTLAIRDMIHYVYTLFSNQI